MSMLTMQRSIEGGFLAGVVSGLGIALADATYASIAAFGLTSLSNTLLDHQQIIRLIGGVALFIVGLRILRNAHAPVNARSDPAANNGFARIAITTYLLTLSNPVTILSFTAIFGGLGLSLGSNAAESGLLVISVFAGSMVWWMFLSGLTGRIRHRMSQTWITRIDVASAAIILVMAMLSIVAGLR